MDDAPTKRALVIGASGQDGSYLSELLVARGYDVLGVVRRPVDAEHPNLSAVRDRVSLLQADLTDRPAIADAFAEFRPDEIYNFAAVTFGPDAWSDPARTAELGTVALAGMLEAARDHCPDARVFQSSSSWVFGHPETAPQNESTPLAPVEPYGAAKAFGNHLVAAYREHYGMFACSGIFFNHESPRRGERFVTRKITLGVARVKLGLADELVLGDLEARRDWSFAGDFVEAVWLMLQQDRPDDYVLARGELRSVREFVEAAFSRVGLDWREHVRVDRSFQRSGGQVVDLVGDSSLAAQRLDWRPKTDFGELVAMMVDADLAALGEG